MNITATLFGQMISFAVFVLFCMKFVWPPIIAAMQEREQLIQDGLGAADKAAKDLEQAQLEVARELQEAKEKAAGIIEQANKRAGQVVEEAAQLAREEAARIKLAAEAEVEQQVNQAKEALRAQVATLAVAGAEKILAASVDQSAHSALLEELSSEL